MKLWADFHTHTVYSHGTGTIRQNVEVAIKKGLSAVGISEHGPANIAIGSHPEDFERMREEIEHLKTLYPDMHILLGCEANVISLDGDLDIPERILKELDYIMVGLHPLVWTQNFKDGYHLLVENLLQRHVESLKQKTMSQNTIALIKAINNYRVFAITHPGLHLSIDTAALAKAAAKSGTALEINAGHGFMTVEYVKIARTFGAKFIIGSDAHRSSDVGNLKKGVEIAEKAGLKEEDIINAGEFFEISKMVSV